VSRFYITTPIYYVNSTPHIGHAYTTIAADIFVRHRRQRGDETFFLTGVDEHASKVWRAAQELGQDPKEYADEIVEAWRELPERVGAEIDFFIRTSDEGHKAFVRDFLQRIYDNGDVYQDVYAGLYCVGCEAFKSEDELVDGLCPDHLIPPEYIEETNYFFRLSAYQDRLLDLYAERPDFVLPRFRYNEARSFIAGGLHDRVAPTAGPADLAHACGVEPHLYPRGHISLLFLCRALRRDLELFTREQRSPIEVPGGSASGANYRRPAAGPSARPTSASGSGGLPGSGCASRSEGAAPGADSARTSL